MCRHICTAGVALLCVTFLVLNGCKPKKSSTIPEPEPKVKQPADTGFSEPRPVEIDTSDDVSFRQASLDEQMRREVEEKLRPVYFPYNEFNLTDEAIERLAIVAAFLNEYPQVRVLIEGHCDERGSAEYNMGLGENRARSVKNYLVNYGVPGIRLEITSWGKERPVTTFCTDEACHSKNRRVEFKVLE